MKGVPFQIYIYCDDRSHTRPVAVTNFVEVNPGPLAENGGWHERPASRASQKRRIGTGMTMIGDAVPEAGWALDPDARNADVRERFELECRKCNSQGSLDVRAEKLFPVLDGWRDAGVSRVPLAVLAASLQRKSQSDYPESGQG